MKYRTILYGEEYMRLYEDGSIARFGTFHPHRWTHFTAGSWRVTGAVRLNNFGAAVQCYSLAEIFEAPESIPWKFKNGKQQTYITDVDHGTPRLWGTPGYAVLGGWADDAEPQHGIGSTVQG